MISGDDQSIMKKELPDLNALWDFNQAAASEAKFRALLPQAEQAADQAYLVEMLSQIARAEGLQAKFDAAHLSLDKAESLLNDEMARPKVRVWLERGRAFNSAEQPEKAVPLFEAALSLAEAIGEENLAVDAAHMLGIATPGKERLRWNKRALAMAEAASDEKARAWTASLYNNIGTYYMEDGLYALAMDMFEKLLAFCEENKNEDRADIARWFMAKIHRLSESFDEALAGQMELLKKQAGKESMDAYVFEELGEIHLALGNTEERRSYFQLAHDLFMHNDRYVYEVKFESQRLGRIKQLIHE